MLIERDLIISLPKEWVNFTKQDRPKAASHAANVRRDRIRNRDLVVRNRARVRIRIIVSRNRRSIKKWLRWAASPKSTSIDTIGRMSKGRRFITQSSFGEHLRFTRPTR